MMNSVLKLRKNTMKRKQKQKKRLKNFIKLDKKSTIKPKPLLKKSIIR